MRPIGRALKTGGLVIVSLGVLTLILLWFAGAFEDKIQPGPVARSVRQHAGEPTARVILVHEQVLEEAVGTVQARQRTAVAAQILATIQEIRVRAGDTAREGDVLVVLDARELRARVRQAEESVTAVQADAERAQADLERYTGLLEQGVVNQAEFDQIRSAARVAEATVAGSQRALEEAEVALTHAEVRAPISGRVVDRLAEPGDTAVPGEPLLTLYNPEALRLEAPVREGLATRLRPGDPLTVRVETLELEMVGEIEEIVPQAETGSRSFLVKVRLPRAAGLYTGMFGRLLIPAGERQRLCAPLMAIQRVGQLEFVDVVTEERAIDHRLVQTGEHRETHDGVSHIEVLSGLSSGERVMLRTRGETGG